MAVLVNAPPCLLFEDDHLLVVNKPPGWSTHASETFGSEGIFDWLRNREPRWEKLSIIQRLDKGTSGVMVFGKTALANQGLSRQFEQRQVRKSYLAICSEKPEPERFTIEGSIVREGDRYFLRPGTDGDWSATDFQVLEKNRLGWLVRAEPRTGRSHQIRVHLSHHGFPILGDGLYCGKGASRLFLHSAELILRHPQDDRECTFSVPPAFEAEEPDALRLGLIDPLETTAFRWRHGAADGHPGLFATQWGQTLLIEAEQRGEAVLELAQELQERHQLANVYFKAWRKEPGESKSEPIQSLVLAGSPGERFTVRENGVIYSIRLDEGYSVGLFLDQRDNRRRLLANYGGAQLKNLLPPESEVLNAFAYTCAFSVCAALSGATTTSVDLSAKALAWGKENFQVNGMKAENHQFLQGDVFDWFVRLARRGKKFDLVLIDPPTFSRSKISGAFRVEKDFGKLVAAAARLVKPGGILFASSNAAGWPAEKFLESIAQGLHQAGRPFKERQFYPQPPDFPVHRSEPTYLKTCWLRL